MAKVAIILTQDFADWEYALLAGTGRAFYGLDIQFFGPEIGQISTQGGLHVFVPQNLDEIFRWLPEVIVVVGGNSWTSKNAPNISELLKAQHSGGGVVAGICGGTLALARAELLNETLHTSNDIDFLKQNAKGYSGSEYFRESATAMCENRVITAPGTAPVSFTAAVFESAGLKKDKVLQFKQMMAAEHSFVLS